MCGRLERTPYFYITGGDPILHKAFCEELLSDGNVQILGYTKYKEMIRLSAKAEKAPDMEQRKWIDIIFEEQPYLSNVYPDNTREIGIVFCIKNAEMYRVRQAISNHAGALSTLWKLL